MPIPESVPRRYASVDDAGKYIGTHARTIRRMVSRGDLSGFRVPGSRLLRVDLNELDAALRPIPTADGAA